MTGLTSACPYPDNPACGEPVLGMPPYTTTSLSAVGFPTPTALTPTHTSVHKSSPSGLAPVTTIYGQGPADIQVFMTTLTVPSSEWLQPSSQTQSHQSSAASSIKPRLFSWLFKLFSPRSTPTVDAVKLRHELNIQKTYIETHYYTSTVFASTSSIMSTTKALQDVVTTPCPFLAPAVPTPPRQKVITKTTTKTETVYITLDPEPGQLPPFSYTTLVPNPDDADITSADSPEPTTPQKSTSTIETTKVITVTKCKHPPFGGYRGPFSGYGPCTFDSTSAPAPTMMTTNSPTSDLDSNSTPLESDTPTGFPLFTATDTMESQPYGSTDSQPYYKRDVKVWPNPMDPPPNQILPIPKSSLGSKHGRPSFFLLTMVFMLTLFSALPLAAAFASTSTSTSQHSISALTSPSIATVSFTIGELRLNHSINIIPPLSKTYPVYTPSPRPINGPNGPKITPPSSTATRIRPSLLLLTFGLMLFSTFTVVGALRSIAPSATGSMATTAIQNILSSSAATPAYVQPITVRQMKLYPPLNPELAGSAASSTTIDGYLVFLSGMLIGGGVVFGALGLGEARGFVDVRTVGGNCTARGTEMRLEEENERDLSESQVFLEDSTRDSTVTGPSWRGWALMLVGASMLVWGIGRIGSQGS